MSMQMYTQSWKVQPNEQVLTLSTHFSSFLRSRKIKKIKQSGKNPQNYALERNESFIFDQKPVKIDIFNNKEETEI